MDEVIQRLKREGDWQAVLRHQQRSGLCTKEALLRVEAWDNLLLWCERSIEYSPVRWISSPKQRSVSLLRSILLHKGDEIILDGLHFRMLRLHIIEVRCPICTRWFNVYSSAIHRHQGP